MEKRFGAEKRRQPRIRGGRKIHRKGEQLRVGGNEGKVATR